MGSWKQQKLPEDDEPLSAWMWVSGGLLCAALMVALYTWLIS
jgi:hypothetical protein